MNKHRVTYSMTTWYDEELKMDFLIVFMHFGDKWFLTRYSENKGFICNYQKFLVANKVKIVYDSDCNDRDTKIGLLKEIVL